jgi:hypothetical protein
MATYYKYAERNADSQVNWAEVGKGISDMLKQEVEIRNKKKADIDQATREFQNVLQNAPQGQYQDANKFTNDYAHSMMEQQMIDNRLLKSGQMKLQDYTYRRQNYVDGTNTLFELQKLYQDNYKTKMEGIQSGKLQALTGANMASIEGFADFSKSKAIIDPSTGVVNVGIMRPNPDTGVMELTQDVAPVNVLKGKILADIPTWDANAAINNTVKNMGEIKNTLFTAATTTKQGSVIELLGLKQNEASTDPAVKAVVDNANKAIDQQINSYFANPYNITSVLTENVGTYSQESFTYNKEEAAKDKSKILIKINPSTGLPTIDTDGANYKAQLTEAKDWVRTQLLARLDNEKDIKPTGFQPYGPQPQQWQLAQQQQAQSDVLVANQVGALYGGDNKAIQGATTFFRDINPAVRKVTRDATGVTVTLADEAGRLTQKVIPFKGADGKVMSDEQFVKSAGVLLTGNPNIGNAVNQRGFIKNATFNPSGRATAEAVRLGATPPNPFTLQSYTPPAGVSATPVSGTIKGGNER